MVEPTDFHLVSRQFSKALRSELEGEIPQANKDSIKFRFHEIDLSQIDEVRQFLQQTPAPNLQIHNAGLLTGGLLQEQEIDLIQKMFRVNLEVPVMMARHWLPELLKRGKGHMVFNTSVSSQMFFPCATTYAASKAGLYAFAESLREEVRTAGLKVLTMVTPGVKTKMYDEIEGLYGPHLDLSFMKSMPAESWAKRVVDAILSGEDYCLPEGSSRAGLLLARHWPKGFKKLVVQRYYKG